MHWFFQRFLGAGALRSRAPAGRQPRTFFQVYALRLPRLLRFRWLLRIHTYFQGFRAGGSARRQLSAARPPAVHVFTSDSLRFPRSIILALSVDSRRHLTAALERPVRAQAGDQVRGYF